MPRFTHGRVEPPIGSSHRMGPGTRRSPPESRPCRRGWPGGDHLGPALVRAVRRALAGVTARHGPAVIVPAIRSERQQLLLATEGCHLGEGPLYQRAGPVPNISELPARSARPDDRLPACGAYSSRRITEISRRVDGTVPKGRSRPTGERKAGRVDGRPLATGQNRTDQNLTDRTASGVRLGARVHGGLPVAAGCRCPRRDPGLARRARRPDVRSAGCLVA